MAKAAAALGGAAGAGAFIGLVSLPAIYFRAVATLDFDGAVLSRLFGKLLLAALRRSSAR